MNSDPQSQQCVAITENFRLEHKCSSLPSLSSYHYHDGCEVYLFLDGSGMLYSESGAFRLKRGDLFIFRPDELHCAQPISDTISPYERFTLHIKESFIRSLSSAQTDLARCFFDRPLGTQNYLHLEERELREILMLIFRLDRCTPDGVYGNDLRLILAFTEFLIRLNRKFMTAGENPDDLMPRLIKETMRYIDSHLTEELHLQNLSACLRRNGAYISRRFKEETGITLRQYLICKRVILAKKLLRENYSLTDACTQSGFHDYSNFNRTFTRQVGCSPSHYQKTCRSKDCGFHFSVNI